jgi:hypothetical protein
MTRTTSIGLLALLVVAGLSACQRETPVEKAGTQSSPPTGVVEQTAQQAVDAIRTPMDKARSVEGTLEQAAGRTAEQVQGATP